MKITGIIIPCYNEYRRLEIKKFCNFLTLNPNYYLCFVNDGSSDKTSEMLHELKKFDTYRISVVEHQVNQGKATAILSGANYFSQKDNIDNIGFLDADLATSLEEMDALVKKLNTNSRISMIFGSRKGNKSNNIERNFFRKLFANSVNFFIQFALQLPINDTQCGAKVFKREIVQHVYNEKFISRWLFDIEIFLRLKKYFGIKNFMHRIHEEPLNNWIEVEGSKITLKDYFLIPVNLLMIWISYLKISLESKNASDIFTMKTTYYMLQ